MWMELGFQLKLSNAWIFTQCKSSIGWTKGPHRRLQVSLRKNSRLIIYQKKAMPPCVIMSLGCLERLSQTPSAGSRLNPITAPWQLSPTSRLARSTNMFLSTVVFPKKYWNIMLHTWVAIPERQLIAGAWGRVWPGTGCSAPILCDETQEPWPMCSWSSLEGIPQCDAPARDIGACTPCSGCERQNTSAPPCSSALTVLQPPPGTLQTITFTGFESWYSYCYPGKRYTALLNWITIRKQMLLTMIVGLWRLTNECSQ